MEPHSDPLTSDHKLRQCKHHYADGYIIASPLYIAARSHPPLVSRREMQAEGLTLYDHMVDNHKTVPSPSNEDDISNNSCSTHLIALWNQMWMIDGNLVSPRAAGAKSDLLLMDYY